MGVIGDEGVVVMEERERWRRASTREHEGAHDGDGWAMGGPANGAKPEPAKHGTASRFWKLISSMTLDDK
jgi:hypothetical protein